MNTWARPMISSWRIFVRAVEDGLAAVSRARVTTVGVVLALLLAQADFVVAESQSTSSRDNLDQLSLADLANVEVTTTSKEPEEVWKTPAAVFVLTQEDIRRSGATTIPEALRLVPGVQVSRIDQDHWAVGIRGFADQFSKSLLVLIDGRSLYTPLFAGVYWALDDGIMIEDVERIEVIRGPGGTIWGANAVNGVINIITKNARDTHGSLASVGGGSVDHAIGALRYGSGDGRALDYRFYGKAFGTGPEYHPDGASYDEGRFGQLGFRSDWAAGARDQFTMQGDMYKGGVGERVGIGSFSPPGQTISDQAVAVSGGNFLVHWRRDIRPGSDLQVQAYYDRTYALAPHYGETRNTFDVDFIHHLTLPWHQNFIWGAGIRISPSDFVETVPSLDFTPHHVANNVYSGFIQDEIAIVPDRFSLTVGTKVEHNNYTGFEPQPSVRALWTVDHKQSLWAAVTQAVRTPSRIEEDFRDDGFLLASPLLYVEIDGNRHLHAERLRGYELGYRRLINPKMYVDFAVFHNEYNDLVSLGNPTLTLDSSPPPDHFTYHFQYVNGIQGHTDGFELSPDWNPVSWLQLKASYSYLNLDLRLKPNATDTGTVTSDEGSSPHNQVSFESRFNLPRGFEFDQTFRYVSALPAQSVPSYSTADVRFSWRATREMDLSIVGENLLQPEHDEFSSDPGPMIGIKRSVYAKISWRRTAD
jgi:iron complex outermembrane recepter protein